MKVANKIKWVLGICVIFLLILATNLIDRNNFRVIKESVVSVYEDRLVAKGLLFDMLTLVHRKEQALTTAHNAFFDLENKQVNQNIDDLIAKFDQTILTSNEEKVYADFKNHLVQLRSAEDAMQTFSQEERDNVLTSVYSLKTDIGTLAQIQQEEGRNQLDVSQHAFSTIELFTQIEVYMLIVLGIIMQLLILYKPKDEGDQTGKYKVLNPSFKSNAD